MEHQHSHTHPPPPIHARVSKLFQNFSLSVSRTRKVLTRVRVRSPTACVSRVSSFYVTAWNHNKRNQDPNQNLDPKHVIKRCGDTMRGAAGAFLQSCLIQLVWADQWRLKESENCDLNRKVSKEQEEPEG